MRKPTPNPTKINVNDKIAALKISPPIGLKILLIYVVINLAVDEGRNALQLLSSLSLICR